MLVIFVPGCLGGVKVSVRQEGEAWVKEGRRERMGRMERVGGGIVVLRVLLSCFYLYFLLSFEQARKNAVFAEMRDERKYLSSVSCFPK